MKELFESINSILAFVGPLSDFFWDFPTNFAWYKAQKQGFLLWRPFFFHLLCGSVPGIF